jgi:deferrochelatase/peroxidase EfeB
MAAATTNSASPDLSDIQGEILQPYTHQVGVHLFLQFTDSASGREFIKQLLPRISTAQQWDSGAPVSMNLGFSYAGLAALGLAEEDLVSFPYPFRVGMADRAPVLGDTGASAPGRWQKPYGSREVHAWLMVQADTADLRDGQMARVMATADQCQVWVKHTEITANFTGAHARAKEHFGFHDGIGEPAIEGAPGPVYPGAPGPFWFLWITFFFGLMGGRS